MSQENHTIKFKKNIQDNHIGYYMTVCNQVNFFNESIYSSYPCYFDYKEIYKIGVYDTFHLDDNSLMYSLIVEYFALDKTVYILAPNLKDIDKNIEPTEIFWSHNIDFNYRTGEPKEEISKFKLAYKDSFAQIDTESICCFSHAFSSPIVSYTFIIGADEKGVKELLQNQDQIPIADEFLDISDYMVTLKIIEDDEGYNNHVHIQSRKRIDKKVEKLEYIMETFRDRYDELILSIGESEDIEKNTKLYLEGVKKLRVEIFDIEYKERAETPQKVLESCLDEYIDLYFEDLEAESAEKTANLILDVICLFLKEKEKKELYLNRLDTLVNKSVISKEIKETVFDYTHAKKVAVLNEILKTKRGLK